MTDHTVKKTPKVYHIPSGMRMTSGTPKKRPQIASALPCMN